MVWHSEGGNHRLSLTPSIAKVNENWDNAGIIPSRAQYPSGTEELLVLDGLWKRKC